MTIRATYVLSCDREGCGRTTSSSILWYPGYVLPAPSIDGWQWLGRALFCPDCITDVAILVEDYRKREGA